MNDSILVTNTPTVEGLYTTISQITVSFKRIDRNKVMYCDAFIGGQEPVSSRQVVVDVWYQPSVPHVVVYGEANDRFPWLQNGTGTLKCHSSDYGNPNSTIHWNAHRGVPNKEGNLIIADLVPNDNGREVGCKLENNFTIKTHMHAVSRPIRLYVEYYPNLQYNVSSPLVVNESASAYVLCEAYGDPSPVIIRWGNGTNGSILKFGKITRQNAEQTSRSSKVICLFNVVYDQYNVVV
ncbi:hypothetical protein ACJMK2_008832 [Sinanodonta woodiana]|uniref:Ig-like domain-containing protein n=1 Tax=Sinanodonta woodiana TaxID=1069815 RepID=A0ABD3VQS2_SINWO